MKRLDIKCQDPIVRLYRMVDESGKFNMPLHFAVGGHYVVNDIDGDPEFEVHVESGFRANNLEELLSARV